MKSEQVTGQSKSGFFVTIGTAAGSTTKRVDGDLLTVGRAEDCHLTISHETLSRRHMTVSLKDGACWVEDHASANGTFVNGKRIRPHSLIRVLPEDQITMGQAGVRISVSAEPVMRKEGAPPIPREVDEQTQSQINDTIVTSTSLVRREQRQLAPVGQPKAKDEAQEQAERQLQEAQKTAAKMIQEAEIEAERRVEDIYRRAHETQAKMDEVYQRRMNEAYRASEQLYQKSQEESQTILDTARQRSAEIRQQAESFVMDLRRRTEADCERMLEEAQQTARDLKEQRLLEAEDIIKQKEAELVEHTRVAMNDRLARFEEELAAEAERQRAQVEAELEERRAQHELEHKEQVLAVKNLKAESKQLMDLRAREEAMRTEIESTIEKRKEESRRLQEQIEDSKTSVVDFNQQLCDLRTDIDRLRKERDQLDGQTKTARAQLAKLHEDVKAGAERVTAAAGEAEAELLRVRAKLQDDKAKLEKEEAAHLEELKLQTTRKVRDLEMKMVDELHTKKDGLVRELALTAETFIKENPDPSSRGGMKALHGRFKELLEKQIVTVSQDDSAKVKQTSLVAMKRRQRWVTGLTGAMVGGVLVLGGQRLQTYVRENGSPIERRVAAAQEERRADLEQRKFNPTQTKDYKTTYVDNVVYTENFVATYSSDAFQRKLLEKLAPYMFKTWKTDESTVIQLLGMSTTLVKTLAEKKDGIHPDFIPQGLEKMRQIETEADGRMRRLLGSNVRVESFKKFEKRFYEEYQPAP